MEVTVQEAKAQFSQLLQRVETGEEVIIRRGAERVAKLVRMPADSSKRRIWGDLSGSIADDFDATPDDFITKRP